MARQMKRRAMSLHGSNRITIGEEREGNEFNFIRYWDIWDESCNLW